MKTPCLFLLASVCLAGGPAVTVYNRNFGVVRESVPLDLIAGSNRVRFPETPRISSPTPSSSATRPAATRSGSSSRTTAPTPSRRASCSSLYEGQTLDFEQVIPVTQARNDRPRQSPPQRLRPHQRGFAATAATTRSARWRWPTAAASPSSRSTARSASGSPARRCSRRFRRRHDPEAHARLAHRGRLAREIRRGALLRHRRDELAGGLQRRAPEDGDHLDLIGWVTIDNQSGKTFTDARVKLMAGDVNKVKPAGSE